MQVKLINKMIISFVIGILVSFLTISFVGYKYNYSNNIKSEATKLYSEANYIAGNFAASDSYYNKQDNISSEKEFKALSIYFNCDIIMLSNDNEIIISTLSNPPESIADFDPTDFGNKYYRTDNFYGVYEASQLTVFYPIINNFTTMGYIIISKPLSLIRTEADTGFNFNYIIMAICFSFSALIFILFQKYITHPLKKMTRIVSKYANGDFAEKIGIKRNDEIGRLSESLDYMASEINSLNAYQKKFIANVSHDFRSPLTSIKGYLEAMLDGTIPVEMQEKYLGIVISETERLTKLTNNLLTMNSVSTEGMILDITVFDIVGIIKQTIATFQGTCEKKKIKFQLIFSDKTLSVKADQSKIQQVIYNLIDNAIKFSNSNSSIVVSANEKGDKVIVSVKDFGIGIPSDSVNKIWERFYKTDLSRGKDKKGTGLGLSIVKEIIVAHKEYIDVISTEGVGTEFIFALEKSKEGRTPFLGMN